MAAAVFAQGVDFPTHRGNNARTGQTADPGPGVGNLTWFRWNDYDRSGANQNRYPVGNPIMVRNNTSSAIVRTGTWVDAPFGNDAFAPYRHPIDQAEPDFIKQLIGAGIVGGSTLDEPSYQFGFGTPSQISPNYDPTRATNMANLSTFTWVLDPKAIDPTVPSGNYHLSIWVPIGPTLQGGALLFPQRYYVVGVSWDGDTDPEFVEVIDTFAAGLGWIRLGNGGGPSNQAFPYDGVNPIRITLYNTIPRDDNGDLLESLAINPTPLVYADAVLAEPAVGDYIASPVVKLVGPNPQDVFMVAGLNERVPSFVRNQLTTRDRFVLRAFQYDNGAVDDPGVGTGIRWSWRETDLGVSTAFAQVADAGAINSAGVAVAPAFSFSVGADAAVAARSINGSYLRAPLAGGGAEVRYDAQVADGDYEIWVYLAGDGATEQFGTQVEYRVYEGDLNGVPAATFFVDQSVNRGWYRLPSTRAFRHRLAETGAQLRLVVTNNSTAAGDAGKSSYADAVRFVEPGGGSALSSTPVMARVGIRQNDGTTVATEVVFVASESGRIYCLDARGLANGSTVVYWAYPTVPGSVNPDPNQTAARDGQGPVAEMPTGFDLSSAVVIDPDASNNPNGNEVLVIGSTNGRVYAIQTRGRGDFNATIGRPGTTERNWTYPNDFPATPLVSNLGAFEGSVAFDRTGAGGLPTIYAPTAQGRLFALRAFSTLPNKVTEVLWAFPPVTSQTLGALRSTPAIGATSIYFGTDAASDAEPGRFFAVNKSTGAVVWEFGDPVNPLASFGNSSPVYRPSVPHGGGVGTRNTVYFANNNGYVYAVDADTGALIWKSGELFAQVAGSPVFTTMSVYDRTGALAPADVLLVPNYYGSFSALFARLTDYNVFTVPSPVTDAEFAQAYRLAWEYFTPGRLIASPGQGHEFLYGGDDLGYLYAFSNNAPIAGQGTPPGGQTVVPNDVNNELNIALRNVKMKFISREMYDRLRLPNTDPNGPTFAEVDADNTITRTTFEWGETVFIVVYNYPFNLPGGAGSPTVNISFSGAGSGTPPTQVASRQFAPAKKGPDLIEPNPNPPPADLTFDNDGYAIHQFPLQSGQNALLPGQNNVSISMQTGNTRVSVPPSSALTLGVANPLALVMALPNGDIPTGLLNNYSIGFTPDPENPQNLVNGSPDLGALKNLLLASPGEVNHGQLGATRFHVVDRSLMTLLRGPGRGLDNVRATRGELGWVGGDATVVKPLDPTLFPGYEQLPTQVPNNSLDYPNINREALQIIKDLFGEAENPLVSGVTLRPPVINGWTTGASAEPSEADRLARTLVPTRFDAEIEVARYQPANLSTIVDSTNATRPGGYVSRSTVYVDTSGAAGNGAQVRRLQAQGAGARGFASRGFNVSVGVPVDEKLTVTTPNVDLGSLAPGAGFSPLAPWNSSSTFSPWTGQSFYNQLFGTFSAQNEGNVNFLNLRLAKGTQTGGGAFLPWPIGSMANSTSAYLDGSFHLWSDLDPILSGRTFAPMGELSALAPVILQKPRVGDPAPNPLTTNPRRRENAFLGVLASPPGAGHPNLNPAVFPAQDPRVGVSLPIGFPVGRYSQTLRLIEQDLGSTSTVMPLNGTGNSLVAYSDPTLTISFNVAEDRLTNRPENRVNSYTPLTAPMVDLIPTGNFQFSNAQPAAMLSSIGNLAVAFTSNRSEADEPSYNPTAPPTDPSLNDEWRIYLATLAGNRAATQNDPSLGGVTPLRDLNTWTPANGSQWFRKAVGPYPDNSTDWNALFNVQAGETILADTVKFGAPSFPVAGDRNPFTGALHGVTYMAFLGQAQKQTGTVRLGANDLFIAATQLAADGTMTIGAPIPVMPAPGGAAPIDSQMTKSRASIVQVGNGATLYFAGAATNSSRLFQVSYNGTNWGTANPINVGQGFDSAGSPSATARRIGTGQNVIELMFSGRIRGRQNSEIYLARFNASGNFGGAGGLRPFAYRGTTGSLPANYFSTGERLVADEAPGVFRASGLNWNVSGATPVRVFLRTPGAAADLDLEVPGTRTVDSNTGVIVFDARVGGKVYVDPNVGTVRLSSTVLPATADLYLEYQPRVLRISEGVGGAYGGGMMLFDNRLAEDASYWVRSTGQGLNPNNQAPVRNSRFIATYSRTTAGSGQNARPFMKTMRLGVRLPFPVLTNEAGFVQNLTVNGMSTDSQSFYQVDPANGRVYFTLPNEGQTVTVNYTGVQPGSGTPVPGLSVTAVVELVEEVSEFAVPIERALNESGMVTALDPLDWSGAMFTRRPGLVWMFWTSTRSGGPDVYFQTYAPRLAPIARR